jgi:hypothetical protein
MSVLWTGWFRPFSAPLVGYSSASPRRDAVMTYIVTSVEMVLLSSLLRLA